MTAWELRFAARQLNGRMRLDARTVTLLRQLELDDPAAHALLIEHLESFRFLDLGRRMWCLINAEWRPVWEYTLALQVRDVLPRWFIAEFRDLGGPA